MLEYSFYIKLYMYLQTPFVRGLSVMYNKVDYLMKETVYESSNFNRRQTNR